MDLNKYNSSVIGLYGLDEEFLLCHLPFLLYKHVYGCLALEGSSGTGKTTLVKRLGMLNNKAGGGRMAMFSADKARYEDFIGCPLPPKDDSLTMVIHPMPNSVSQMEMVLVDELNRASYDNQEKWLSLFASREIDGMSVKCKYIYAAMNPILTENKEIYEGTQPIDKALGERIMCLIKMPEFSNLDQKNRLKILTETKNQVEWSPTDNDVALHSAFVKEAIQFYDYCREQYLERVANYVDDIQASLKQETRGAITIEARRAQFIVNNVLGVHALNSAKNESTSLEYSALQALLVSFPNPLWEQPINREALNQVHSKAKGYLQETPEQKEKSKLNLKELAGNLGPTLERLKEEANKDDPGSHTIEQMSKMINNELPLEKLDPVNHYIYAIGAVAGLTWGKVAKDGGISDKLGEIPLEELQEFQLAMKEEEFNRLYNIAKSFFEFKEYVAYKDFNKANAEAEDDNVDTLDLPYYIQNSSEEGIERLFCDLMTIDLGRICAALVDKFDVTVRSINDLLTLSNTLVKVIEVFKSIQQSFAVSKNENK